MLIKTFVLPLTCLLALFCLAVSAEETTDVLQEGPFPYAPSIAEDAAGEISAAEDAETAATEETEEVVSQDWYQVELLVFARTRYEADLIQEEPSFPAPAYPANLTALMPVNRTEYPPLLPGQLASLEEHDELLAGSLPWGLHPDARLTPAAEQLEVPEEEGFEEEDILLGLPLASGEPQDSAYPGADQLAAAEDRLALALGILRNPGEERAWRQRPEREQSLRGVARRINRAEDLRVLIHRLWQQPVSGLGEGEAILVQAGPEENEVQELDGYVTVERARFLHLHLNLWFSSYLPHQLPEPETAGFQQAAGRPRTARQRQVRKRYQFRQSRKLAEGELHYLDHPQLGVLVRVGAVES